MAQLESSFKASRPPLKIVRSVLFALFLREMQTRFGARRMGFIWVVMEPLAILVVILAFHALMRTAALQGQDIIMFMVTGIVPFHMMRNIAWRLTDSIQANMGLFAYRQVMPFDTFIARTLVEICAYSCAYFVICFVLGFWFDHDVLIYNPLGWLVALFIGTWMSFSIGILCAIISHEFNGTGRFLRFLYIPLYISAGVFFPIYRLPENKLYLVEWNPYVDVIEGIRRAAFEDYPVTQGINYTYPIVFSIVLTFVVMAIYRSRRQVMRAPVV